MTLFYFIPPSLHHAKRRDRLPHNSTPSMKMAYTHAKSILRQACDGCVDVTVSSRDELIKVVTGDAGDSEESSSEFEDD